MRTTCSTLSCASYQLANTAAYASERIDESLKSIGQSIGLNSIMAMSPCDENRYRTTIERALGDTPAKQMANVHPISSVEIAKHERAARDPCSATLVRTTSGMKYLTAFRAQLGRIGRRLSE